MHNDIKTEHYAMLHVQHSGEGLGVIPHHLRTLKVVEAALQVPGLLLRHTPLELLNEALLIKMMRRDGWEPVSYTHLHYFNCSVKISSVNQAFNLGFGSTTWCHSTLPTPIIAANQRAGNKMSSLNRLNPYMRSL